MRQSRHAKVIDRQRRKTTTRAGIFSQYSLPCSALLIAHG